MRGGTEMAPIRIGARRMGGTHERVNRKLLGNGAETRAGRKIGVHPAVYLFFEVACFFPS